MAPPIFSARLVNVRSLGDTGLLKIRPITILVGQNNSGKSSFTRFFPLLKQSIQGRASAPLLWYGPIVDFGSFSEVLSTFSKNNIITVEFELPCEQLMRFPAPSYVESPFQKIEILKYRLDIRSAELRTEVCSFSIFLGDDKIEVSIGPKNQITSVILNDEDYSKYFSPEAVVIQNDHLVPLFATTEPRPARRFLYRYRWANVLSTPDYRILEILRTYLHANISQRSLIRILDSVTYHPRDQFVESLQQQSFSHASWRTFVRDITDGHFPRTLTELRMLCLVREIPQIMAGIDAAFRAVAGGISYVGPARAPTDRYYRMQELAVDQIDPAGTNFAMFLNSLSVAQLDSFAEWTREYIGYSISPVRSIGHVSLMLRGDTSAAAYNLVDMGYGFSQIFPVLAQIWLGVQRTSDRGLETPTLYRTIAIEQPELHLHPAFQAKIADTLAGAVTASRSTRVGWLAFVVETHSEVLINRLGELVSQGKLNPEDIAIYLFNKDPQEQISYVKTSEFDRDGVLSNWPFGFFSGRQITSG